jgi:hypothetical protein
MCVCVFQAHSLEQSYHPTQPFKQEQFNNYYYFLWLCSTAPAMASSSMRFLDHTQRRAIVGMIPLDER